jgi:hypothetical protein
MDDPTSGNLAVGIAKPKATILNWQYWKDKGFEEGFEKGFDEGQEEGYKRGFDEGQEEGYKRGFDEGQEEGYKRGFDEGQEEGYKRGFDCQQQEAWTFIYQNGREAFEYGYERKEENRNTASDEEEEAENFILWEEQSDICMLTHMLEFGNASKVVVRLNEQFPERRLTEESVINRLQDLRDIVNSGQSIDKVTRNLVLREQKERR